ncbi:hypothetical protein FRAHR75_150082 [Frankia sp. Hr75.2]|nr:hypothetical protein FRAHR75_150082 [Frankia sp. Hr75.2]
MGRAQRPASHRRSAGTGQALDRCRRAERHDAAGGMSAIRRKAGRSGDSAELYLPEATTSPGRANPSAGIRMENADDHARTAAQLRRGLSRPGPTRSGPLEERRLRTATRRIPARPARPRLRAPDRRVPLWPAGTRLRPAAGIPAPAGLRARVRAAARVPRRLRAGWFRPVRALRPAPDHR